MDDKDLSYLESELGDGNDDDSLQIDQKEYELWMADSEDVGGEDEPEPETEVMDFNKPDFNFTPKARHNWKQRGYYIHCTTCDLGHGVHIGADQMMTGIDEKGDPILKSRSELNFA